MKKSFTIILLLFFSLSIISFNPNLAAATTGRVSVKTTMKWDASALKIVTRPSAFDYSNTIRNAYIKKVENYAKRNKIKVITAKVVNGMRE
jgi:hypothetical protein